MVGRDLNSYVVQHRTWMADNPDLDGYYYSGLKSGDTALENITAYQFNDGYFNNAHHDGYDGYNGYVDYNLPDPLNWKMVDKTLPITVNSSQLAVIDGYIYLFGGINSNKILRASTNNPAEWEITSSVLPNILGASQIAVVGSKIYLFGGNDGYATDHIYTAFVSNPLSWVDEGALLPGELQSSQLAIIDSKIYLFGGKNNSNQTNVIYSADVSDPLTWTNTGYTLPNNLSNSSLCLFGNAVYLFGGLTDGYEPTNNVYKAPISNPTNWFFHQNLPYKCYNGQFFAIGNSGYLISPCDNGTVEGSYTRILKSNMATPGIFIDLGKSVPGTTTSSQVAIIYDRPFLFGGNGSSLIFASDYFIKYDFGSAESVAYSKNTRFNISNAVDDDELFLAIGFPYWKTDYKNII